MAIGKKIALGNGFNLCDSEDFYLFDLAGVMRVGPRFESQLDRFKKADKLATRVVEVVKDLKPIEVIQELKIKI